MLNKNNNDNNYQDKAWCEKNKIRLDFNYVMQDFIGNEQGLSDYDFKNLSDKIDLAIKTIKSKRENKKLEWLELPYNQENIVQDILDYADYIQKNFESVVVLGIGGSALGPIALQQAINHPFYNELPEQKRKYPRFYVADNIDPERLVYLFDILDLTKTLFIVISKSGSTSETMSQFMIIKDMLEKKLDKPQTKKI